MTESRRHGSFSSSTSSLSDRESSSFVVRLADEKLENSIKDVTRRTFLSSGSGMRSRSWDGRTGSLDNRVQGSQIELRHKVSRSNHDMLTRFFKYYLTQMMTKNEQLNNSYLQ